MCSLVQQNSAHQPLVLILYCSVFVCTSCSTWTIFIMSTISLDIVNVMGYYIYVVQYPLWPAESLTQVSWLSGGLCNLGTQEADDTNRSHPWRHAGVLCSWLHRNHRPFRTRSNSTCSPLPPAPPQVLISSSWVDNSGRDGGNLKFVTTETQLWVISCFCGCPWTHRWRVPMIS